MIDALSLLVAGDLAANHGMPLCDECVAADVRRPVADVRTAIVALSASPAVRTLRFTCAACQRTGGVAVAVRQPV